MASQKSKILPRVSSHQGEEPGARDLPHLLRLTLGFLHSLRVWPRIAPGLVLLGRAGEGRGLGPALWRAGVCAHPKHLLGPCFGSKHGKDPGTASNIQHHFVLEHMLVVVHGVPVSERPHLILQHFLYGRKKKAMLVYARPWGIPQGHGPQDCFTKFFRDLNDVIQQSRRIVLQNSWARGSLHHYKQLQPQNSA